MSEFYHEIRAFLEKNRKKCERGNMQGWHRLAKQCLTFSGKSHSAEEVRKMAMLMFAHSDVLKDCVVFNQRISGDDDVCESVDGDHFRLPYEKCVFDFECRGWDLMNLGDSEITNLLVCAVEKDEATFIVTVFVKYEHRFAPSDLRTGWCLLPYAVGFDQNFAKSIVRAGRLDRFSEITYKNGNSVSSGAESELVSVGLFTLNEALTVLNRERYTIQTAQPPKSLYSNKAPGHRKFYEHRVIVIDPDQGNPRQGDNSGLSGRKHPLHSVRGFWRKLKKPKADGTTKVWVKPHWRGDKELGVVTKEYRVLNTTSQP